MNSISTAFAHRLNCVNLLEVLLKSSLINATEAPSEHGYSAQFNWAALYVWCKLKDLYSGKKFFYAGIRIARPSVTNKIMCGYGTRV